MNKINKSVETNLPATSYVLRAKMLRATSYVLLAILLVPFTAKSQVSVMDEGDFFDYFIGVTAGIGLTSYTGSVSFYADQAEDCDPYHFNSKSGFETNFLFGLQAEWRIAKRFDLYASLLYENRSAKFDPQDYKEYVYVSDAKPFELGSFNRSLDAKINIFSITPMIKYRPFDFDLGILVGPSFAYIVSDELHAKELILEPKELYFSEIGGRERTIYSGQIKSKRSRLVDLKLGLSYEVMLTKRAKLSPEIFYVLPLTQVNYIDDWKITSIQFLVSLSYRFQ